MVSAQEAIELGKFSHQKDMREVYWLECISAVIKYQAIKGLRHLTISLFQEADNDEFWERISSLFDSLGYRIYRYYNSEGVADTISIDW